MKHLSLETFEAGIKLKDAVNNKSFDIYQDQFFSRMKSYDTGWVIESANFTDIIFEPAGGNGNGQLKINAPLTVNDGGNAYDVRFKGEEDDAMLFMDSSENKIGFGTDTPSERLHVIGNFIVGDLATSVTKSYRFRTSGSDLDFDFAGKNMTISGYPNADYSGTQRTYIILGAEFEFIKFLKKTIFDNGAGSDMFIIDSGAEYKAELVGNLRIDGLRIDQTPAAETPTATHTITVNANGTNYKLLCVAA